MAKKINWLNHTIELAVVFIGITAAFMLNNWRENVKDNELLQKYMESFYNDIKADSKKLGSIIPANEAMLKRAGKFAWGKHDKDKFNPDSVITLIGNLLTSYSFEQKRTTYESITNSGNLNLISDYHLRNLLIDYYENFEEVKTKEKIYFDWLNAFAIPFVYEHMDMVHQKLRSLKAIKSDRFANLVVGYYFLLQQNLDTYKSVKTENDSLLQLLKWRKK